jgi:hypothetical protein
MCYVTRVSGADADPRQVHAENPMLKALARIRLFNQLWN